MVHFVGAGPGAPDLITLRGVRLLREADQIIYAGSLVNPILLKERKPDCIVRDSAGMTLEEVLDAIQEAEMQEKTTVRLHTGDPSIYGAIREQMDALDREGILYDVIPGVSAFCGAAAALQTEYTVPGVSQTVIITRAEGRTPVPDRERLSALAAHQCTMVLFLSAGLTDAVQCDLLAGGYAPETPAAIVSRASWPDEKVIHCTLSALAETAKSNHITRTALIMIGDFLGNECRRSCLYDPSFTHGYREGTS